MRCRSGCSGSSVSCAQGLESCRAESGRGLFRAPSFYIPVPLIARTFLPPVAGTGTKMPLKQVVSCRFTPWSGSYVWEKEQGEHGPSSGTGERSQGNTWKFYLWYRYGKVVENLPSILQIPEMWHSCEMQEYTHIYAFINRCVYLYIRMYVCMYIHICTIEEFLSPRARGGVLHFITAWFLLGNES